MLRQILVILKASNFQKKNFKKKKLLIFLIYLNFLSQTLPSLLAIEWQFSIEFFFSIFIVNLAGDKHEVKSQANFDEDAVHDERLIVFAHQFGINFKETIVTFHSEPVEGIKHHHDHERDEKKGLMLGKKIWGKFLENEHKK